MPVGPPSCGAAPIGVTILTPGTGFKPGLSFGTPDTGARVTMSVSFSKGAPHSIQNFEAASFFSPHFGHFTISQSFLYPKELSN